LLSQGTACYYRSRETVAGHDRTTVASIIAGRETRRSVIDAPCTVIRGRSEYRRSTRIRKTQKKQLRQSDPIEDAH